VDVSADDLTVDAPWRIKNAKRAQRRRNTENHARNLMHQRDLNNAFAAAADQEYRIPIGTIAEAALLTQQLPHNP
jgi:hypothetical protein